MTLDSKLLLSNTEVVYYLFNNPTLPIFIVSEKTKEILYKINYKNSKSVLILDYYTDKESVVTVDSLLSAKFLNNKIYTIDGITKYLDLLEKG